MIRLGLQLPTLTFDGVGDGELFEATAAVAVAAERSGFDSIFVTDRVVTNRFATDRFPTDRFPTDRFASDHFSRLPLRGPGDAAVLESYTLLGGLAVRTSSARLGALVTGVTHRNPAILAKEVTTLDIISAGRAVLGIGAAWSDAAYAGSVELPAVGERMDRLEEAIQICRAMFSEERPSFSGRHYRIADAFNQPPPLQGARLPILIGGGGEKRTLKLAASYADAVNLIAARDEIPRKLDALARHCEVVGRDPQTINKTWLGSAIVGSTRADAEALRTAMFGRGGIDWSALGTAERAALSTRLLTGTPVDLAADVLETMAPGLDGVVLNFPANGADADAVSSAGRAIRAALDA